MTYPTYAVSDTVKDREVIKVAAVTGLRSDQNQLQDLLRRIVSAVERPAPIPEISDIEKLLLQLARVPPDGPALVVDTPVPPTLEHMLRSVLDGQRRWQRQPQRQRQPPKQRPVRRDWSDVMCFSWGRWVMQRHVVRTIMTRFHFCNLDGRRKRRRGVSL